VPRSRATKRALNDFLGYVEGEEEEEEKKKNKRKKNK